jgi:hypothetical protein
LNFDQLGLTPALLRAVGDMGLYAPTPIQAEAIPAVLKSADVWATAPTGSGKTLAFALPLLQHLLAAPRQTNFRRPVRTLVLVPTRELAVQVGKVLSALAQPLGLKVAQVYGGVSINPQMMGLRGGADMLVATEQARSMTMYAAMMVRETDPVARGTALSAAKALVGRLADQLGKEAIQLHGGIAMTEEYKAGHYFKRLSMLGVLFGDVDHHLRRVVAAGGLPD